MNNPFLLFSFLLFTTVLFAGTINKPVSSQHGFIENKGQIIDQNNNLNPSVLYLYNGNGLHVQLKQAGFSYEVWKIAAGSQPLATSKMPEAIPIAIGSQKLTADSIYIHRIDISFVNSNPNAIITASESASDYINYYTTGTTEQGVTNVHHYKKVLYQNIYPNIDVEFVLNENKFKYNFIVHPNGNVNDIQLKFDGANNTSLTTDGHITIETAYGNIDESIPLTYQLDANNIQQTIIASFTSNLPNSASNIYGIMVGQHDATKTLIIDPVPWATYYGGSSEDEGYGIVTDIFGNVIITGNTKSTSSIATSGAFQTTYGGNMPGVGNIGDAFITKFNNSGAIQWATYYGGSGYDVGYGITTDTSNNILITGAMGAYSTGMATSGSYQTSFGGYNYDAFVAKFSSSGSRIWSTYYGGVSDDYGQGIKTDISGNVFITGYTSSTSGIASSGAFQSTYGGGFYDAFIAKFNSTGTIRQWASYYGGSLLDVANGIAVDVNGNILIVGQTQSTSSIASSGAFQSSFGGGTGDAFVVKFSTTGSQLWATYYGGSQQDFGQSIATDTSGNILITGKTTSTSGIATSGTYQTAFAGAYSNVYIAKFSNLGSRIWGTYYGGGGGDYAYGIITELSGNMFITGLTLSNTGIATSGSYQTTYNGGSSAGDAFVAKFSLSGSRLWATYYGGLWDDYGQGIAVDANGNVFITGYTNSPTTIATSGAYQTTFGGGPYDAFVAAFTVNGSLPVQLTSFDAKLVNSIGVLCSWQTASELNNDYFEIERSTVGSPQTTEWKVVGKVKGNGTSNSVQSYQFTDNVMLSGVEASNIYYRLKQVDFDGKSSLSEVRVVNFNQSKNTEWNIYPNPATNELHIETSSSEKLTAQVFDITGKKVIENILFTNTTTINTSSLVEGMYFLRITNADGAVIKVQKVGMVR